MNKVRIGTGLAVAVFALVALTAVLTPEQALAAVISAQHGGNVLAGGGLSAAALASLPFLIGDTNSATLEQLRTLRTAELDKGRAILAKATTEKRELTADERTAYDAAVKEATRLADEIATAERSAVVPQNVDRAAIERAAVENERRRAAEIRSRCKSVSLSDEFADGLVSRGIALEHVGDLIVNELAARGGSPTRPGGTSVGRSSEDPAEQRGVIVEALLARSTEHAPAAARFAMTERARDLSGLSLLDMLAEYARMRGEKIEKNLSRAALYDRLNMMRSLSTSDFPIILADAGGKIMVKNYQLANVTYRLVFARKRFADFKPHKHIRVGDFPNLLETGETGEFKVGAMSEAKQELTLATYGRRIKFSRRTLINDDMGAFADLPAKAGRRVADFENATAWAQLALNSGDGPTITETTRALANTTDNTKASSGAAIGITTVGTGREKMMNKTSLDGLKLNVMPRYLVTGPGPYTVAEQFCAMPIIATQEGQQNPFKGRLTPVGDANLTGNGWWLFADPADFETLVYGYLDGAEGPRMMTREGFEAEGIEMVVALDFVAGAVDFRGAWRNPGP